ncbi:MAG: GNAT family N-acetyltransferase [Trueperaceae bacterium]|nr:GNAT family N-acetyltransferase [Trueperaceae bacterium]
MIRTVKQEDALALSKLLRSLSELRHVMAETAEISLGRVRAHLKRIVNNPDVSLLIDEENGVLNAYCHTIWHATLMHQGGEGYIAELFVHPDKRGKNIGSQLLEQIRIEAKARGCSRLCLLNMRNRPSYERGFYLKHGWVERPLAANFIYDLKEKS